MATPFDVRTQGAVTAEPHNGGIEFQTPTGGEDDELKKKGKRGGARNTGKTIEGNKSGLAGITFQRRPSTKRGETAMLLYVCTSWTVKDKHGNPKINKKTGLPIAKRTTYSIKRHGADRALMMAINDRSINGLPTPPLTEAAEALVRFMRENEENP